MNENEPNTSLVPTSNRKRKFRDSDTANNVGSAEKKYISDINNVAIQQLEDIKADLSSNLYFLHDTELNELMNQLCRRLTKIIDFLKTNMSPSRDKISIDKIFNTLFIKHYILLLKKENIYDDFILLKSIDNFSRYLEKKLDLAGDNINISKIIEDRESKKLKTIEDSFEKALNTLNTPPSQIPKTSATSDIIPKILYPFLMTYYRFSEEQDESLEEEERVPALYEITSHLFYITAKNWHIYRSERLCCIKEKIVKKIRYIFNFFSLLRVEMTFNLKFFLLPLRSY